MKLLTKSVLASVCVVAASHAMTSQAALITYNVSNAINNNGNDIGHGLYTFGKFGTGPAS